MAVPTRVESVTLCFTPPSPIFWAIRAEISQPFLTPLLPSHHSLTLHLCQSSPGHTAELSEIKQGPYLFKDDVAKNEHIFLC